MKTDRIINLFVTYLAIIYLIGNGYILFAQTEQITVKKSNPEFVNYNKRSYDFQDIEINKKLADEYRAVNNLPDDFPATIILNKNNPSSGMYFLSSRFFGSPSNGTNYMMCLDTCGTPVFYRALNNRGSDFRLQPNGYLTQYPGDMSSFVQYDSSYNEMMYYNASTGYTTDMHELMIENDGTYWVFTKEFHLVDMSVIVPGGNPNATVEENIIQHLDLDGNILFQWNSLDHIPITDCDPNFVDLTGFYIDYIHVNAMDFDVDGNLLLSSRHLNEITKIDIVTGNIIWRWGGSHNEFTFINDDNGFYGQHSIRSNGDNSYTLFDNGNWHVPPRSRGVEYLLDDVNMTATLVSEYTTGNSLSFSDAMAHMQNTEDGGTLIGWAANTQGYVLTDYNANGEKVLDMMNIDTNLISYRAYKYEWETNAFYFADDTVEFDGGIFPGDSVTAITAIYNNSNETIEISGYHTNNSDFSIVDVFPIEIPAKTNMDFTIAFMPTGEAYYTDALTLYSNSNSDSLRIAAQVRLIGGLITSVYQSIQNSNELKIVPNPIISQSKIIVGDSDIIESIKIIDFNGRIVYQMQNLHQNTVIIDRTMLSPGLFLIEVKTATKFLCGKLQVSF